MARLLLRQDCSYPPRFTKTSSPTAHRKVTRLKSWFPERKPQGPRSSVELRYHEEKQDRTTLLS